MDYFISISIIVTRKKKRAVTLFPDIAYLKNTIELSFTQAE